jgi:hypothetical protein
MSIFVKKTFDPEYQLSILPGNSYLRGRLSTFDLHIKIGCFQKSFSLNSNYLVQGGQLYWSFPVSKASLVLPMFLSGQGDLDFYVGLSGSTPNIYNGVLVTISLTFFPLSLNDAQIYCFLSLAYLSGAPYDFHTKYIPAIPENIRLGWKCLSRKYTLALIVRIVGDEEKSFERQNFVRML